MSLCFCLLICLYVDYLCLFPPFSLPSPSPGLSLSPSLHLPSFPGPREGKSQGRWKGGISDVLSHFALHTPAAAFTMDSISTAILLLLLALVCLLLTLSSRDKGKLPPGPRPLSILGNLLLLCSQDMLTSLTKLSKEYGSMYTVHLGPRRVVVLSGYQAVKEALVDQGEEFSGRGDYPAFFNFTKGNGIAFSSGDRWKVLRQFSIQILRNFGMGKRSIEERILEEGSFLLAELRKTEGEPFDPTFVLSRSVSNIICSVLFGSRFDYDDERLLTIIRLINDNFQIMSSPWGELYDIFPSLLDWVPGPHQRIFQNFKCLRDLIAHSVHDHQASLDPRSPRDFIQCFLTKMAEEKEDPLSHFHMDTLLMTTHNLLFGGTKTGAVCAWESRWRAWSSFCTSPPSCRAFRCSRWVRPRTST
eukprot:XP_011524857.1 cytochrome P450 2F1 isoform X6 [Homo sapiens]